MPTEEVKSMIHETFILSISAFNLFFQVLAGGSFIQPNHRANKLSVPWATSRGSREWPAAGRPTELLAATATHLTVSRRRQSSKSEVGI